MQIYRRFFPAILLSALFALAGCSTFRDTLPPRAATEQVLLSKAADQAVEHVPTGWMKSKAVFVDDSHLEAYDKPYVVERVRAMVLDNGGRLVEKRADAAVVLELASGGLSIDTGDFLVGLPSITIPVPFGGQGIKLPELAFFKIRSRVGKAKLLFNAVDAKTGARFAPVPIVYGRSVRRFWTFLFLFTVESGDIPAQFR